MNLQYDKYEDIEMGTINKTIHSPIKTEIKHEEKVKIKINNYQCLFSFIRMFTILCVFLLILISLVGIIYIIYVISVQGMCFEDDTSIFFYISCYIFSGVLGIAIVILMTTLFIHLLNIINKAFLYNQDLTEQLL